MTSSTPDTNNKVGITLAVIQLFFTLTWTVYVIFLPQLAAQVGLGKDTVLVILMMDQLIVEKQHRVSPSCCGRYSQ